jgi:hypothetical protein
MHHSLILPQFNFPKYETMLQYTDLHSIFSHCYLSCSVDSWEWLCLTKGHTHIWTDTYCFEKTLNTKKAKLAFPARAKEFANGHISTKKTFIWTLPSGLSGSVGLSWCFLATGDRLVFSNDSRLWKKEKQRELLWGMIQTQAVLQLALHVPNMTEHLRLPGKLLHGTEGNKVSVHWTCWGPAGLWCCGDSVGTVRVASTDEDGPLSPMPLWGGAQP